MTIVTVTMPVRAAGLWKAITVMTDDWWQWQLWESLCQRWWQRKLPDEAVVLCLWPIMKQLDDNCTSPTKSKCNGDLENDHEKSKDAETWQNSWLQQVIWQCEKQWGAPSKQLFYKITKTLCATKTPTFPSSSLLPSPIKKLPSSNTLASFLPSSTIVDVTPSSSIMVDVSASPVDFVLTWRPGVSVVISVQLRLSSTLGRI